MMRKIGLTIVVAVLVAGCSGGADSTANGDDEGANRSSSDAPDPCSLADESLLVTYFGDAAVDSETTEAGPIQGCSWRNENANSLLIQTANNYDLFRPDACNDCVDLNFGDDGYASPSPFQSTATVVAGSLWLSVTTTGFGDDAASITELLETVFENATG